MTTFLIVLEGMAKEIPANSLGEEKIALFIPMTSPLIFSRGPPALPGLVGTSVTIVSGIEYDASPCVLPPASI